MVAFEWTSDVWAPAAIALLGTVIGVLVAVYFARRAAIRAVADDRELQLELVRLGRERDAIDGLDTAILILRDVVSNWAMSLADETTSATPGTQAVKDEFFRFTRTAESLYVRLRPELRSVIVPFAQATEWVGYLRGEAEMLDTIRQTTAQDDPRRAKALDNARNKAHELLDRIYKMQEELRKAADLYAPTTTNRQN